MPDCLKLLGEKFLTAITDTDALTDAETLLLNSVSLGRSADNSVPLSDSDLRTYATTHSPNTIRATLIRWLCSNPEAHKFIDPGGIRLGNYRIIGTLSTAHPPTALDLCSLTIPFPLIFHRCVLPHWLLLLGAEIPFLDLDGCHVGSIAGDVLKVRGDLYMRNGFCSEGIVKFPGASVGGDFDCSGATLTYARPSCDSDGPQTDSTAMTAEGIHVAGDLLMTNWRKAATPTTPTTPVTLTGFKAIGRVRLDGAQIDGDINCTGATFVNKAEPNNEDSGEALTVRGATIGGHVWLRKGFCAEGAVRFTGAKVKGSFECGKQKAEFKNPWQKDVCTSGVALELDGADIALDLILSADKSDISFPNNEITGDRFTANGTVSLVGARVGRTFHCQYGDFKQASKPQGRDISPEWRPALDLEEAHVAFLCYPNRFDYVTIPPGQLLLDGFTYDRIRDGATTAGGCLKWINLQYATAQGFIPQPYLQLAKVLREEGETREAKKILLEMEDRRPRKGSVDSIWKWLQRVTIGYGYESWKALKLLALLSIAGSLIYYLAYMYGAITPTNKDAYMSFTTSPKGANNGYPGFHPVLYSLESSVPFLRFGQLDHWQPDPGFLQKKIPAELVRDWLCWVLSWSGGLNLFHSCQVLLGWFLATMAVAGLTGLSRRE